MRFSDMMGSGDERSRKATENENPISDALAPYLDAAEAPEATEPAIAIETAPPDPVPTPAPRVHTVESVFPVVPVEPLPAAVTAEREAATSTTPATPAAATATLTELADFTPLSDDLLPRRR